MLLEKAWVGKKISGQISTVKMNPPYHALRSFIAIPLFCTLYLTSFKIIPALAEATIPEVRVLDQKGMIRAIIHKPSIAKLIVSFVESSKKDAGDKVTGLSSEEESVGMSRGEWGLMRLDSTTQELSGDLSDNSVVFNNVPEGTWMITAHGREASILKVTAE